MSLAEIYARIPAIECARRCRRTCGPVPLERAEHAAIVRAGLRLPVVRAGGRFLTDAPLMVCPALDRSGACNVYPHRPLICRLYGVAEGLECRWGCKPDRYLTRAEAAALVAEMGALR